MPDKDKLFNIVWNNPDGYGLIVKDTKESKLQIFRECPKENDPEVIYKLLQENIDLDRFLHVRHRTCGPINLDNTHPFTSYWSEERQVYFFHNGTLQDYKPSAGGTTYENGVRTERIAEEATLSDSKKFNDQVLSPLLNRFKGDNGLADIHDPVFQSIFNKYWGYGVVNKGLLVSNDQNSLIIGKSNWTEIDGADGKKHLSSNGNEYSMKLQRGPEFERRKKKEEENKKPRFQGTGTNITVLNSNSRALTNLKDVNLKPITLLTEELVNIFEDNDIESFEGLSNLCYLTEVELEHFVEKNPVQAGNLLIHLTNKFSELYGKYTKGISFIRDMKAKGSSDIQMGDL